MTWIQGFPNGLTLACRPLPGARAAALGLWLALGARFQPPGAEGWSHLLEHLLFKGAGPLDGAALALRFAALGGRINAHTDREFLVLHGLVPADGLGDLLGLFTAMLLEPRFTDADLDLERSVIAREAETLSADDLQQEQALALAFPGQPLGRGLLGDARALAKADARALRAYLRGGLTGARLWVSAAGAVDPPSLAAACAPLAALPPGPAPDQPPPRFRPGRHHRSLAGPARLAWLLPAAVDEPATAAAAQVLGDGPGSRLYRELRERRGLVYGLESRLEGYTGMGLWSLRTACAPAQADRCRTLLERTIAHLAERGPGAAELAVARARLRAGLLIEAGDPEAAMERLARDVIHAGRAVELEERLDALAEVTAEAVALAVGRAWRSPLYLEWR